MALRPTARTIADLRRLLANLEKNRHTYDLVSFAQLRRILRHRIVALTAELRGYPKPGEKRRAA